jgi:hypothetical protein
MAGNLAMQFETRSGPALARTRGPPGACNLSQMCWHAAKQTGCNRPESNAGAMKIACSHRCWKRSLITIARSELLFCNIQSRKTMKRRPKKSRCSLSNVTRLGLWGKFFNDFSRTRGRVGSSRAGSRRSGRSGGSGEPAWVNASLNACFRLGPDPRIALWPAASPPHKQAAHMTAPDQCCS